MNKKEKAQLLFERMELIDDKFVDEAANYVPKKEVIRRKFAVVMALAACLSILIAFGIGSMFLRVDKNAGNESYPEIITISSVLKKSSLLSRSVDPAKLDLLDGESRIIWQDTESGEYYQVKVSADQQSTLKRLNSSAKNVTDTDSEFRIWFVSDTGEVTSPELTESSGNVSCGTLFSYDPELELTDTFLERLDTLLN